MFGGKETGGGGWGERRWIIGNEKVVTGFTRQQQKEKKIGSQQLTTASYPTLFQYGLENWLSRLLQLEQYETFSVFFSQGQTKGVFIICKKLCLWFVSQSLTAKSFNQAFLENARIKMVYNLWS